MELGRMNLISANSREVLVCNPDNPENFTYDAAGNKLRTTVGRQRVIGPIRPFSLGEGAEPQGGGITGGLPGGEIVNPIPSSTLITTDYCGNAVYRDGELSMLLTEEGYVTFTNDSTPVYHYYLKDHLGSIRVVFDQSGAVEQRNDYYPSGTLMYTSTNGTLQPYKFGGKELERTAGLDEYDFGARWMDPVIGGRFTTMDPMCEKYYGISPYVYCGGDPVNAVDPDGRAPGDFFNTINEAAIDFGNYYNGTSILWNVEFGATIYMIVDENNNVGFTYSIANKGDHASVQISDAPYGATLVARIHTHGNSVRGPDGQRYDANSFSGVYHSNRLSAKLYEERYPDMNKKEKGENDIGNANQSGCFYSYLVSPNGTLQQYNVFTGKISIVSEDMPSSSTDADRRNINDAKINNDIGTERISYSDFRHISPFISSAYFKYWMEALTGKKYGK